MSLLREHAMVILAALVVQTVSAAALIYPDALGDSGHAVRLRASALVDPAAVITLLTPEARPRQQHRPGKAVMEALPPFAEFLVALSSPSAPR